ncbi:DUF1120 domain-containing protein [Serratia marcescens]|nr:DUF1120 domain-containing protein [Serratia marcescens]
MQQSVCALAVLAATTLPAMAESVDVRVIGTITPAACTPTLSGGGTVDYGTINPNTLSATDYTVQPVKQLDISITCDAPAKVALKAINGRPNTLAGAVESAVTGYGYEPVALVGAAYGASRGGAGGLGLDGSSKIGGYAIALGSLVADGSAADVIASLDTTAATWAVTSNADGFNMFRPAGSVPTLVSAAAPGTTIPMAFTNLAGKLSVQAYINHASELDLTKPVALDGLTTLELVYM